MTTHHAHPSVYLFLILPFGAMSGYLTVSLAWLFAQNHVSTGELAGLIAISFIPHTWKFLWAPIVDTTFRRKGWYALASIVSAAGIFAMGTLPATRASLPLMSVVVLVANVAVTFLGMSVDSIMAYGTAENEKGRAGGWFQAGNLGGGGIGGGVGLWMTQHLPHAWMSGAALAVACLLCMIALRFVNEPPALPRGGSVVGAVVEVARDVWGVVKVRTGFLALLICFLPIGTGAAGQLWSAVAADWRASADVVAIATGAVAGVMSMVGCLIGGWISDRMNRQAAYALFGLLQAGCAVAMAFAARTPTNYIVFTLIYAVFTGFSYAGFTAVVLEAIGTGAAATKYNLYASLSNMPIQYMTVLDGKAHDRWGAAGMLQIEALFCMLGIGVFAVTAAVLRRRSTAGTGPAAVPG